MMQSYMLADVSEQRVDSWAFLDRITHQALDTSDALLIPSVWWDLISSSLHSLPQSSPVTLTQSPTIAPTATQ